VELDKALLYLNIRDERLRLYTVKEMRRGEEGKEIEVKIEISLREDAGLTARFALARKIGLNPFALAPFVLRERTVGVLGIDRSHDNGSITDEEFKIEYG